MKFLKLFFISITVLLWTACDSGNQSQNNQTIQEPDIEVGESTEALGTAETEDIVLIAFLNARLMNEVTDMADKKKGTSQISELTRQMEQEHEKIVLLLGELADKLNVELPRALTPAQLKEVEELNNLNEDEFDAQYVQYLIDEHQESITELQKLEQHADYAMIQGTIDNAIEILKNHLDQLQQSSQMS